MSTDLQRANLLDLVRFALDVRRRVLVDQITFPARTALLQIHLDVAGFQGIAAVVEQTGCSPSYFREAFRSQVGASPRAYLRCYRIFTAFKLLVEDPNLDFATLAARVGYATGSSLSHAFRTEIGLSPTLVRRGLRGRIFPPGFSGLIEAAVVVSRSAEAVGLYPTTTNHQRSLMRQRLVESVRVLQQRTPPLHSMGRPP